MNLPGIFLLDQAARFERTAWIFMSGSHMTNPYKQSHFTFTKCSFQLAGMSFKL